MSGAAAVPARDRITLLVGRNTAARQAALRRLIEGWVDPEWMDFNYSEAEARDLSTPQLLTTLSQIAVGDSGKHRVLVVRGVERLRANEAETLATALARTPAHARLILVADGDRAGRDARVSGRIVKAVEAEGRVHDFPQIRAGEVAGLAASRARDLGVKLAPDALRALAARVGPDATVLERELEKLLAASEPGEIMTAARVEALVAPSVEHSVFELTDAIGERDPGKARAAVASLLESGQTVYMLLPMLARQLRLVWGMKALAEKQDDAGLKDPNPAKLSDWQRSKLQRQAQLFSWPALEAGMTTLFEADLTLKGIEEGPDDPRALLETVLLRLLGRGRPVEAPDQS